MKIGVNCVFSREAVQAPQVCATVGDGAGDEASLAAGRTVAAAATDGSLNCHGYGSSVTVTATFGMVAAQAALDALLAKPLEPGL